MSPNSYYEKFTLTGEVKCIDDEIPFDLPRGWEWCRLGEVSISMADGPFGSNLKSEHYTEEPQVRIIQLSNIGELGWKDANKKYTTYKHLCSIERSSVDAGDIVVAKMMPAGRAIICPNFEKKYVLSSDAVKVKPTQELDIQFLLFVINSEVFRSQVYGDVQGITRIRTSITKLKGYLIPLPPLSEQQRIVAKIEELIPRVEQYGKAQSELEALNNNIREQLKKSVLQYAIEGRLVPQCEEDGTAEELLQEIQAEKQRLYAEGKLKKKDLAHSTIFRGEDNKYYEQIGKQVLDITEEVPYDLPLDWRWTRLRDIAKDITDFVASGSFASLRENVKYYNSKEYAILVRTKDFQNNFTKDLIYTDKHGYEFLSNSNLFGGELILPNIGSIGKGFIVPFLNTPMTLAPNSIMIRAYEETTKLWLYYTFLSNFGQHLLNSISSSTAQRKFNKTALREVFLPFPPLVEQKRIAERIEQLFSIIEG